ncbi:Histone-Lysine N-Methyltransferase ash1l [Mortierella polycephala]|uniref:Histone-Lysine N-Methyltransferase ash1l n=1 Tax=Mortierella polycephala TaxID=41804 RepID=A0A9P6UA92_9FUNG|nr:Histone-Lysine N-Methyltransferase ash1l [Mortierella polycephala]
MAVKKRKLTVSKKGTKISQATAEAELQREEEEMLAMTRMLKQVDETEAISVAKKILGATVVTTTDTTTDTKSNGASNMDLDQDSVETPESVAVHGTMVTLKQEGSSSIAAEDSPGTSALAATTITTTQSDTSDISGSAAAGTLSKEKPESERWLADLTVANMQQQNRAHEQEDQQRLQEIEVAAATSLIADADNELLSCDSVAPSLKEALLSTIRSGLRKVVALAENNNLANKPEVTNNQQNQQAASATSDADASSIALDMYAHSEASNATAARATSIISDISDTANLTPVSSDLAESLRANSDQGPNVLIVPGFNVPLSVFTRPRVPNNLITRKARTAYAPEAAKVQPDQPRRRPGRPPGYFLGPTSCAFCRQQHRKCDYNTVCHRCVKAKISCDRSGTVERPTVIVREARLQAKAEAAAVLAAAVAAGLATLPEPKPRQRAATEEEADPTVAGPSTNTRGIKRRRTPSPSSVSRDNIIEERVKRVAATRPVQKYDPSIYLRPQRASKGQSPTASGSSTGKGVAASPASQEDVKAEDGVVTLLCESGTATMKQAVPSDMDPGDSNEAISVQRTVFADGEPGAGDIPIEEPGSSLANTKSKKKFMHTVAYKQTPKRVKLTPDSKGAHLYCKTILQPGSSATAATATATSMAVVSGTTTTAMATKTKRRLGRPPGKQSLEHPSEPSVKRPVGRPTNATRYAQNPSLIPTLKPNAVKRKPGRPPKVVLSSSPLARGALAHQSKKSVSVVPSKRSRDASNADRNTMRKASDGNDSESSKEESLRLAVRQVKKAYLKSGLYSSDLKTDPVNGGIDSKLPVRLRVSSKQATSSKTLVVKGWTAAGTSSSPRSSPFFQLPINYGAVLMSKQKDFRLPYDIMQAWKAGLLSKTMQPEPFTKIRSRVDRVGCGEDCYNRVMFYECVSAHCPCGDQCSNQRFQRKHNEDHLRVIWTKERGFGIQTKAPIKKGSLVIEYRGEVISQIECHRRMETIYKNNKNFYFLEYEKGEVVDACQKGTNARFVNHSCAPNSQIEKWFLNGEMSIGIFASQDIPSGAEISYDYNFSSFSGAQKQKCRCGAPSCRGYIGERISKNKDIAGKNKETASTSVSQQQPKKKVDARKRKAGRGRVHDQETASLRFGQMPSVQQIRQRQSDKYKEVKMAAIRYTRLFLFRNIRLVESKYIKYAQTKSRSYQENVPRSWLTQARQCRKRSLEGVIDDLRASAEERERVERMERCDNHHEESSVAGDDSSDHAHSADAEGSIVLELDEEDADDVESMDAMDELDADNQHPNLSDDDEEEVYELESDNDNDDDDDHSYLQADSMSNSVHESEGEEVDELTEEHDDNFMDAYVNALEDDTETEDVMSAGITAGHVHNGKKSGVDQVHGYVTSESLEWTVSTESSPSPTRGSIDTLVEETAIHEKAAQAAVVKPKRDYGPRRLRNRVL